MKAPRKRKPYGESLRIQASNYEGYLPPPSKPAFGLVHTGMDGRALQTNKVRLPYTGDDDPARVKALNEILQKKGISLHV